MLAGVCPEQFPGGTIDSRPSRGRQRADGWFLMQGLNEELAARDRALRRAAQERSHQEEALAQVRRPRHNPQPASWLHGHILIKLQHRGNSATTLDAHVVG